MGWDASVMCNCWKEGKTTPPPVRSELIHLDEEGYLALALPWEGNEDKHEAFHEWQRDCCAHEGMAYAKEWFASYFSYRYFQHALQRAGWEHFPALKIGLPES